MELNRTVDEVAALTGGRVEGRGDRRLAALCGLERAGPDDLAAVFRERGADLADGSSAGCLLVSADARLRAGPARSLVRVADPLDAVEQVVAAWGPADPVPPPGVHPSAVVEPGAELGAGVAVGPGAVVGAGARVGARSRLHAGVVVGAGTVLGEDCVLHPHVVLGPRCTLGDRVTVHAGSVLGSDGFGYRMVAGRQVKIAQVGTVIVGDDVSVGANCTIDRARFDATVIGAGCKLDDQVHIGHNCVLGEDCAIAGQTALGGSIVMGARVLVGGCAGIREGVRLGDEAMVAGASLVTKDVAAGTFVAGHPARLAADWRREVAVLRRLADRGGAGAEGAAGGREGVRGA